MPPKSTIEPTDFFAERARLAAMAREADEAEGKLTPLAQGDDAPWQTEPDESAIHEAMQLHGMDFNAAKEYVKSEMLADAKRLASFAPEASKEIADALEKARAAKERAADLLAQHEATLESLTAQIFLLGEIRKKINVARALTISTDTKKQTALAAINHFVERRIIGATPTNLTGWKACMDDLTYCEALRDYIDTFCKPLEAQAAELVKSVKAEAASNKIELRRVFALLESERGKRGGTSLDVNCDLYAGLI